MQAGSCKAGTKQGLCVCVGWGDERVKGSERDEGGSKTHSVWWCGVLFVCEKCVRQSLVTRNKQSASLSLLLLLHPPLSLPYLECEL